MPTRQAFCLACCLILALVMPEAQGAKTPIQILQDQDPTLAKFFGEPLATVDDLIVIGDHAAGKIHLFEGRDGTNLGKLLAEIQCPEPGIKGFGNHLIPMDKALIVQAVKTDISDDGEGNITTVDRKVYYYYDCDRASPAFGQLLNVMPLPDELFNPTDQSFMYTSMMTNGTNLALSRYHFKEVVNEISQTVDKLDIIDGNPASPTYGQSLLSMNYPVDNEYQDVGMLAYIGDILVLYTYFISDDRTFDLHYYDVDPQSPTFGQDLAQVHQDRLLMPLDEMTDYDPAAKRLISEIATNHYTHEVFVFDLDPASATFGEILTTFPLTIDFSGWAWPSLKVLGNRFIISDAGYDGAMPGSGAIHVFDNDPASATYGQLIHTLENPTPGTADYTFNADQFGTSLAIAGGNIVTSAIFDDTAGLDAGAVYIFDGVNYSQKAMITSPHRETSRFGHTVVSTGDFLAVSIPLRDGQNINEGAVQLYDPATGSLVATLENPDHLPNDLFGEVMASDGRLLAVKSTYDATGMTHAGRVYLFDVDPESGTFGQSLTAIACPTPEYEQFSKYARNFGTAMHMADGKLLIGSPNYISLADTHFAPIGRVFIYDADPSSPQFGQELDSIMNPTLYDYENKPESNTRLSDALAFMGDYILMGSVWDGDNASGDIFVVDPEIPQDKWDNEIKLQLNDPAPESKRRFGAQAAIAGDVIAVTSAKTADAASSPSVVYLYDGKIGSPTAGDLLLTLENPEPARTENFGNQLVAREGMLNIGALNKFSPEGTPGRVYIYNVDPASPAFGEILFGLENPEVNEGFFGNSLAVFGTRIFVGDPFSGPPGVQPTGAVQIYDLTNAAGNWNMFR